MTKRTGLLAKMYYSATVLTLMTHAHAFGKTWIENGNTKDVDLTLETAEADTTTRANNGWRSTQGTLKEGAVEFEMLQEDGDAAITAVKNAWLNGTEIAMAVMDGAIATPGSQGLVANFSITNFSRSEPLEEAISYKVTAKVSSQPQWYEATGS